MKAAVVTSFDRPPDFTTVDAPVPEGPREALVDVIASGLHPRVRSQSDGSHYTSTEELPLVPGIDGVGRAADGTLRYFILGDTTIGAMAEQTVIDVRRSVVLPADTDPYVVAAAMNPAMSSWVALRQRIEFTPGQSVLVFGATGSAGSLAVQIAKHLGAGRVVAAGRDATRLASLDGVADALVSLVGDDETVARNLAAAAADVDVVIDYLWGEPAANAMRAIVMNREDAGKPLTWIQIGSVAGATAEIPSAALRAARLQIVGSGQGSVPTSDIVAELADLSAEISRGTFALQVRTVPLADVTTAWTTKESNDERVVIVP